ncbi:MAG TPA: IS1595 family transposase [Candidatus Dormibacteraeota bacterium]|nr:IS1595 family transposase [Candidatus Dormibacteraeota bacterium]
MPTSLCEVFEKFGNDENCREYLESLRWPKKVACPECKSEKISRVYERKTFDCDSCRYQFSVLAGTMFHDTHLPLHKWFAVTYLLCESRKGMSANQIKRMMGVSYKTAWYLCHRIRAAMKETEGHKLKGTVEIDETYVGGKTHDNHKSQWDKRTPVIGIRERGGCLHFIKGDQLDQDKMYDIIARNVDKTVDVIITDESRLYNFTQTQYRKVPHKTVNHGRKEYVRGDVYTNTIESAFSLLKRGIIGTWHRVSAKHLSAYLDEMTWRFNNRKNPYLFRDTLLKMLVAKNVEYKELTRAA